VWVRLQERITAAMMGPSPRARVLACNATGIDHIDVAHCASVGMRVVSLKGETEFLRTVSATAELTWALLLSLLRHVHDAHTDVVTHGRFARDLFSGTELRGKTIGIVGMGRLGSLVAGYARAFSMHVLGADPRTDFPHALAERVSLDDLLGRSDIVSVHVDYGPHTHHLIDARALSLLQRHAVLINTSRGGVVDEHAVVDAIVHTRLAGIATDVLDGDPHVTAMHPLVQLARTHRNILVTPHIGGNTAESFEKTEVFLAGRVVDALRMAS
jgi:D-3-phosphoglycerate dehydrogenase / 2-oxoglutarate reductase